MNTKIVITRVYLPHDQIEPRLLNANATGIDCDDLQGWYVKECATRSSVACKGCKDRFKCPVSLHERLN